MTLRQRDVSVAERPGDPSSGGDVLVVIWPAGDRHDPKPLHSCPTAFQLSIARFEDGLTLDSFAQSVGKVFKTELNAIWVFQEHFKPNNGGRGPRFDFKKFGF